MAYLERKVEDSESKLSTIDGGNGKNVNVNEYIGWVKCKNVRLKKVRGSRELMHIKYGG